jgi:hypothetical protein
MLANWDAELATEVSKALDPLFLEGQATREILVEVGAFKSEPQIERRVEQRVGDVQLVEQFA